LFDEFAHFCRTRRWLQVTTTEMKKTLSCTNSSLFSCGVPSQATPFFHLTILSPFRLSPQSFTTQVEPL